MTKADDPSPRPDTHEIESAWPVVSPDDIAIADFSYDLAYMGVYLRLEVCNLSPYLVSEAEIRIDGYGQGHRGVAGSREVKVGPLLPGVRVHGEVGISERGGIYGVSFNSVAARAVSMTPPALMMPAAEYPGLTAEIVDVTVDENATDLRTYEDDTPGELRTAVATAIRVRVRNGGPAIVERVRLKLEYFETYGDETSGPAGARRGRVAKWILDMPRKDWNPYRVSGRPDASYDPADPLRPGETYEFGLVHYEGGPHGWSGRRDDVSVEVCELRLRA